MQLPPGVDVDAPFTIVAHKFYSKYEETRIALGAGGP